MNEKIITKVQRIKITVFYFKMNNLDNEEEDDQDLVFGQGQNQENAQQEVEQDEDQKQGLEQDQDDNEDPKQDQNDNEDQEDDEDPEPSQGINLVTDKNKEINSYKQTDFNEKQHEQFKNEEK